MKHETTPCRQTQAAYNRDLQNWGRVIAPFFATQGYWKMRHYLQALATSESFLAALARMRARYRIPAEGFSLREGWVLPPPAWVYRAETKKLRSLLKEVTDWGARWGLYALEWSQELLGYVFYGESPALYCGNAFNLCRVVDLVAEKQQPLPPDLQEREERAFPIVLCISPYATERDLLDYIKKVYTAHILPLQKKHAHPHLRIGKVKRKKEALQSRNALIYQHRHLPLKEIRRMLAAHGFFLDDGHIAKIRSLERKRRKEV